MREFSISAYGRLAQAVDVPLLVAETSDGAHMNSADFIAAGAATFGVRASTTLRGGITGAMRTAHLADAYRLRAEVHGSDIPNQHLCMAISNTTYYESLVTSLTVTRERHVDENGLVHAPTEPGIALPAGSRLPDCAVAVRAKSQPNPSRHPPRRLSPRTQQERPPPHEIAKDLPARRTIGDHRARRRLRMCQRRSNQLRHRYHRRIQAGHPGRILRDHRLGRLHPPPGGRGVPGGEPGREDGHRHVRRQRRRLDVPADQGAALRPHRRRLAGRRVRHRRPTSPGPRSRPARTRCRSRRRWTRTWCRQDDARRLRQGVTGAVPVRRPHVLPAQRHRAGRALVQQDAHGRVRLRPCRRPGRSTRPSGRRSPRSTPATSSVRSATRTRTSRTSGRASAPPRNCTNAGHPAGQPAGPEVHPHGDAPRHADRGQVRSAPRASSARASTAARC